MPGRNETAVHAAGQPSWHQGWSRDALDVRAERHPTPHSLGQVPALVQTQMHS